MTKKGHEMLCIWGGRMPHEIAIMPGGVCEKPTVDKVTSFLYRLKELQSFVDNVYIPDVIAVAKAYPKYFEIGKGCENLLSYGGFEENNEGTKKYFSSGTYVNGKLEGFDPSKITEQVKYSRFFSGTNLNPSKGETVPQPDKKKAYSWVKAPRYEGKPMEVGPLARMVIEHLKGNNLALSKMVNDTLGAFNAPIDALFSVLGRHATRALECKLVADKCAEWVMQLDLSKPVHTKFEIPDESMGMGLTEAPRGALGHWITIKNKKIDNYQAVVPTTWNASPRDDKNQLGPMEQALIGTPVADPENPIEPARVVRSFDPCLACAIHILEPGKDIRKFKVA
jgi:hydrogenase large subunit